jgi:hypothetical protein
VSTSVSLCLTIILLLIPHQLQLSSCRFASARSRSSTQRTAQALQLPTDLSERSVGSCGASDLGEVSQRRGLGNLPVETPFRLSGSAPLNTLPLGSGGALLAPIYAPPLTGQSTRGLSNLRVETPFRLSGSAPLNTLPHCLSNLPVETPFRLSGSAPLNMVPLGSGGALLAPIYAPPPPLSARALSSVSPSVEALRHRRSWVCPS